MQIQFSERTSPCKFFLPDLPLFILNKRIYGVNSQRRQNRKMLFHKKDIMRSH